MSAALAAEWGILRTWQTMDASPSELAPAGIRSGILAGNITKNIDNDQNIFLV